MSSDGTPPLRQWSSLGSEPPRNWQAPLPAEACFDSVQDPHQQARRLHHLRGFGDIVVVDFSVPAWIAEDGVGAREERTRPLLLALDGAWVGQGTRWAEALFMRSTPITSSVKPPS